LRLSDSGVAGAGRIVAILAALACGTALSPTAHAGSAATAEYARQVSSAQVRLAQLEALLAESELRIEQLEEVIRQQGKTQAQRLENIDQVNAEVVRLRGAIEVLQFEVAELKRATSEQQIAVERRQLHAEMRLAQIEKFLTLKPPPPPTDASAIVIADWVRKNEANAKYHELFNQAREAQIPVLNANRFFILIGHVDR
jgi:septal ring factor EnvC (AmiA/AmiB activator)